MISKILEEAMENIIIKFENMVRRIEVLEEFNKKYYSNQRPPKQYQKTNPGLASPGQTKYIRILGGDPWPEMTKAEAGKEIDRLLKQKEMRERKTVAGAALMDPNIKDVSREEPIEPKEVDIGDAGLDEEGLL